ncbi:MAG: hypothetical protein M1826_003967 [Phylliscum demangeonii]|nr:MAG: hypothetical protein M1826_003967 [Phylliscum demangeonii]
METVFDTPELISSLANFTESRIRRLQEEIDLADDEPRPRPRPAENGNGVFDSILFLRVCAAADYYTTNATLMSIVPAVDADIILDPYIMNVLPKSLAPTAGYLLLLAVASYYVSDIVWRWLDNAAQPVEVQEADGEIDGQDPAKKNA